jgi:DNA polymerase III subunit beta
MFVTEKAALAGALAATKDAVRSKSTVPILANVHFARSGDRIAVTASNLDLEISTSFAAEIGDDFEDFTCPAGPLTDFVRNAPDGFNVTVTPIRAAKSLVAVQVAVGKSKAKLATLPASDFPSISDGKYERQFSLNASSLAKALSGVVFAVETNEQRYAQCGVLIEPDEKGVAVVASDGNRMAMRILRTIEFDEEPGTFPAIIVPTDAVTATIRMLDKAEDVVLDVAQNKIRVAAGETTMVSRLVDGTFLDYRAAVLSPAAITATLNTKALHDAVQRVLTVSTDKKSGVAVDVREHAVRLLSRDASDGEAEDEIPAVAHGRARNGFNGKFLQAALAHVGADEIEIAISDDRGPMQIKPVGDVDGLTIMKLGPMRVLWHEEASQ